MSKDKRIVTFIPLFLSIAMAVGFGMGYYFNKQPISDKQKEQIIKLKTIIDYVDDNYVDNVDKDELMERAIASMLKDLDPHSTYIPAQLVKAQREQLRGSFEGVGIQFAIYNDTLVVERVIEGGPSDRAGLRAGDRILRVDGELLSEKGISNNEVISKLKGAAGSKVQLALYREGELIKRNITRGSIDLPSIEDYFMINNEVGYMHIRKFSEDTGYEFQEAAKKLLSGGMDKLVIDLRDNTGGYLSQVQVVANAFLEYGDLIVYTEGENQPRQEYRADGSGMLKDIRLSVIINEHSASASEILAGAIQDHDRGYIVGRRSFGKGLVQSQKSFQDGSELRLTVSRYYTPSGRSIQKPYGDDINYSEDFLIRQQNGELYSFDSTLLVDSLKYKTLELERDVYGGGGIMPDVFVPYDSSNTSTAYNVLYYYYREFIFYYLDDHRSELLDNYENYKTFGDHYTVSDSLLDQFIAFARDKGETLLFEHDIKRSEKKIRHLLKLRLAGSLYGSIGRSYVLTEMDPTLQKAVEKLDKSLSALLN